MLTKHESGELVRLLHAYVEQELLASAANSADMSPFVREGAVKAQTAKASIAFDNLLRYIKEITQDG